VISETAGFRSNDNDNTGSVVAALDVGNFGTSYAAGYVTGAGAVVRDYFAQGFYPTGDRVIGDRVANVSGALVKAALIASAHFQDGVATVPQENQNIRPIRRTRSMNIGTVAGVDYGIVGNSEQGYGRVVLTQALPLAGWSRSFATAAPLSGRHNPAQGLLVSTTSPPANAPEQHHRTGGTPVPCERPAHPRRRRRPLRRIELRVALAG
jgi:hypothetical protein